MEFLYELYETQAACSRHFVHELTSEEKTRMKCVAKIVAMPGTRTIVADLCMFAWLRVMKEDQDLSMHVYGRSLTRDNSECGCEVNSSTRSS